MQGENENNANSPITLLRNYFETRYSLIELNQACTVKSGSSAKKSGPYRS